MNGKGHTYSLEFEMKSPDSESKVVVRIFNYSVSPRVLNEIHVSQAMETYIIISRMFNNRLSEPYSNCQSKVDTGSGTYSYKLDDCIEKCKVRTFAVHCGFIDRYDQFKDSFYTNYENYSSNYAIMRRLCLQKNFNGALAAYSEIARRKS